MCFQIKMTKGLRDYNAGNTNTPVYFKCFFLFASNLLLSTI